MILFTLGTPREDPAEHELMCKIQTLVTRARAARRNAFVLEGGTKVGAALNSRFGNTHVGCNSVHRYRIMDLHAERSAIAALITAEGPERHGGFDVIVIVSKMKNFIPCGSCLDWIFEVGVPEVKIGVHDLNTDVVKVYDFKDLMPEYPSR